LSAAARLWVVIATYNEIDTLPRLTAEIWRRLPEAQIVIVDDNSPDGTGQWCERQRTGESRLQCLHRAGRLGLGGAAAAGFRLAIDQGAQWVATLDADFSHDPDDLQAMCQRIADSSQTPVDCLIGSRYVAGGRIADWPWRRRLASRIVNGFSRLWLRLPTRDNSGALRVYRASILRAIEAGSLRSGGFAYLEEVLWRIRRVGGRSAEWPIEFRDRVQGRSKLRWIEVLRSIRELAAIPWSWTVPTGPAPPPADAAGENSGNGPTA
jgi:dolichol-phosphate mannosyltransferase